MTWCGSCCRGEPECMLHPRSIHPPPPPPPPPVWVQRVLPWSRHGKRSRDECSVCCIVCHAVQKWANIPQECWEIVSHTLPLLRVGVMCAVRNVSCFSPVPVQMFQHLIFSVTSLKTLVWNDTRRITQKGSRSLNLIWLGRKGAQADTMSPPYSPSFTAEL